MKNLWRKIASGALALAMMFTLAACGKENGGADAASVMVAAQQELTKISSMRYTYAMEMAISAEGQSVEMKADGTAEVTMNPSVAKMTMNMDMLGMALKDVQIYMVSEGGQMVAYTGMDMTGAGQNQWYKSLADASGMNTDQYDAVEAFELYMKNGSNSRQSVRIPCRAPPPPAMRALSPPICWRTPWRRAAAWRASPPCWERITAARWPA